MSVSDWDAAIEAAAQAARNAVYRDSAGTGFDEDGFEAAIRALRRPAAEPDAPKPATPTA